MWVLMNGIKCETYRKIVNNYIFFIFIDYTNDELVNTFNRFYEKLINTQKLRIN